MRHIKLLLGFILILLALTATSTTIQTKPILSTKQIQRLTTIINIVKTYYYKSVDSNLLLTCGISGMLTSLDPHSSYLDKESLKQLEILTLGKLGGIGVEVISENGLIKVISPLDDTPAHKAGIKPGDYIVQIDNKLVRDMTIMDAINMMRGKKGTLVILTILRKNENNPLILNLRREIIKLKTVKERMLEPGYGYIRLSLFQEPTERDMINAIKRLQKSAKKVGLKGIILDMRNNPGGLVDPAVQIADDFLDADSLVKNDLIVYAKGQRDEKIVEFRTTPGDILPNIPIGVLINEGSASAAEIVAGALQDHKRAIIIGTRSFGKGSMQTVIPINKDTAIKLTTALYYTPLGRSIQARGIEPDIIVKNIQISKKDNANLNLPRIDETTFIDHIKNGNENISSISTEKQQQKQSKTELDLAYKDYQLYEALHILKSQNVIKLHDD